MYNRVLWSIALAVNFSFGADLNQELAEAARKGNSNKLMKLLEAGASVSATDKRGRSAVELAFEKGHEEIAGLLIMRGANVKGLRGEVANFALAFLIMKDPTNQGLELRASGATADPRGRAVLWTAVELGLPEMVKRALDFGVDVNAQSEAIRVSVKEEGGGVRFQYQKKVQEGWDALTKAIKAKNLGIVKLLLDRGANPNRAFVQRDGGVSCHQEEVPLAERRLIPWGAKSPADGCVVWFQPGGTLFKGILLTGGLEPVPEVESTPLCLAAEIGTDEILKLLLIKGADPRRNTNICDPLQLALKAGRQSAADLIKAARQ